MRPLPHSMGLGPLMHAVREPPVRTLGSLGREAAAAHRFWRNQCHDVGDGEWVEAAGNHGLRPGFTAIAESTPHPRM
jgi:hypothetical protein